MMQNNFMFKQHSGNFLDSLSEFFIGPTNIYRYLVKRIMDFKLPKRRKLHTKVGRETPKKKER